MTPPGPVLVIGCGNPLRGDDAAAHHVVEAIQRLALDSLETLALHQLTPELAERLSRARAVLFVDAAPAETAAALRRLDPPSSGDTLRTHGSNPATLLNLTRFAFDRCPPAWLLTIPAAGFTCGASLSALAQRGVEEALRLAETWYRNLASAGA